MPYIGRDTDKLSNVEVLDNITFDGSSSYTLQKNSVNFTPSSANTLLVSIDGVVQAGNFTVSGSTIDFGTAVAGTSTCDFILHYGTGLITTPADGTVTTAKIGSGAVTSAKMFSGFANGITMADSWRLTADTNSGTDADVTTNWERTDTDGYGNIGTGLTESSGIFSFPQTGIYFIDYTAAIYLEAAERAADLILWSTQDNSTYGSTAAATTSNRGTTDAFQTASTSFIFNITNITTHKFKFSTSSFGASTLLRGNTDIQETGFSIIRIGDSI